MKMIPKRSAAGKADDVNRTRARWLALPLLLPLATVARADALPSPSAYANFDGAQVHYESHGNGSDVILFVHGWACSAAFWEQSVYAFRDHRTLAIDLPGHGSSDKPHVAYQVRYFAQSIEAVMRHAHAKRAVIVGHSMGASVAREFYRLYPGKTLGLVFVDGLPWIEAVGDKNELEAVDLIASLRANYPTIAERQISAMLKPVQDQAAAARLASIMIATPDYVAISAVEGMLDFLRKERMQREPIGVPLQVILSESGPWRPDVADLVHAFAPAADYEIWAQTGHFIMLDKPALLNDTIENFIQRHGLL